MKSNRVRTLVLLAAFSAIAFVTTLLIRIPVFEFLEYDPKDVVITLGGFLFGPVSAAAMALVVSFAQMFTVGTGGPIGFLMSLLASLSFCVPAAFIYHWKKRFRSAVIGLLIGIVLMTAVMLIANLVLAPYYMGLSQEAVRGLLLPVLLPFNLVKCIVNSVLVLLLYQPMIRAFKAATKK